MKKYGVFSGWFKLSGHRGRLSFLFSSLIQYLLLAVVYYLFLFFPTLKRYSLSDLDKLSYPESDILSKIESILF